MGIGRRTQPLTLALASIGIGVVVTVIIVLLVVRGAGDTPGTTAGVSPTPTPAVTSGAPPSPSASAGLTPSAPSRPPTPAATPTHVFRLQWIDLPPDTRAGRYRLCGTMDPDHRVLELDTRNDSVWHDLEIDPRRGTVRQVGKDWTSCRPGVG